VGTPESVFLKCTNHLRREQKLEKVKSVFSGVGIIGHAPPEGRAKLCPQDMISTA